MEEALTTQEVIEHYGYKTAAGKSACWKIDRETLNQLSKLPEVLDPKKKFRVTFDYDPEFPRALIQIEDMFERS